MQIGIKQILIIVKETAKGFWYGVTKTSLKKRIMLFIKSKKEYRQAFQKWHGFHHVGKQTVKGFIKGVGRFIDGMDREATYPELRIFRKAMDKLILEQRGEYVENMELFHRFKILVTLFSDCQGYYRDMFNKLIWYMYDDLGEISCGLTPLEMGINLPSRFSKFYNPADMEKETDLYRLTSLKECSKKLGEQKNIKKEKEWIERWEKKLKEK